MRRLLVQWQFTGRKYIYQTIKCDYSRAVYGRTAQKASVARALSAQPRVKFELTPCTCTTALPLSSRATGTR